MLKEQNEIVKQRLHYHFANSNGEYNIPKDMPFVKEFLSSVDKLCKMVDKQTEVNDFVIADVSKSVCSTCGKHNNPFCSNPYHLDEANIY